MSALVYSAFFFIRYLIFDNSLLSHMLVNVYMYLNTSAIDSFECVTKRFNTANLNSNVVICISKVDF